MNRPSQKRLKSAQKRYFVHYKEKHLKSTVFLHLFRPIAEKTEATMQNRVKCYQVLFLSFGPYNFHRQ
jgi:hypothetical protein